MSPSFERSARAVDVHPVVVRDLKKSALFWIARADLSKLGDIHGHRRRLLQFVRSNRVGLRGCRCGRHWRSLAESARGARRRLRGSSGRPWRRCRCRWWGRSRTLCLRTPRRGGARAPAVRRDVDRAGGRHHHDREPDYLYPHRLRSSPHHDALRSVPSAPPALRGSYPSTRRPEPCSGRPGPLTRTRCSTAVRRWYSAPRSQGKGLFAPRAEVGYVVVPPPGIAIAFDPMTS